ncbi:putative Polyadenylate-binding protein [Giardia muris]|uniref:Putative Polyadenylate-binding protein n=1 Tax=Giardia muris TaxID=5742 RepID=A0A4Z1SMQ9_GIAMU|nr:putative Polyadenylate-binding protein [Giardia muris]|eukprot:TNJ26992.1 putative Polyadenylate-binding protein [Giardia muris]
MLQLVVSNIPGSFDDGGIKEVFKQAKIPLGTQPVCLQKPLHDSSDSETKFVILTFDNRKNMDSAIDILQDIEIRMDEKVYLLHLSVYKPDFKERRTTCRGMIQVTGIGPRITLRELRGAYSGFGELVECHIKETKQGRVGYLTFDTNEQAERAVRETTGKYLGEMKIVATRTLPRHPSGNSTILIRNIPPTFTPDTLRGRLVELAGVDADDLFHTPLDATHLHPDTRKPEVRTNRNWTVIQLKSPELCQKLISAVQQDRRDELEIVLHIPKERYSPTNSKRAIPVFFGM